MRSVRVVGFGIDHYREWTFNLGTGESGKKHEHLIPKRGETEVEVMFGCAYPWTKV